MNFRSSSTKAHKTIPGRLEFAGKETKNCIQKMECMYGTDAVRNASKATAEKVSAFKVSQTKSSPRAVQAKKNEFERVKEGEAMLENVHEPPPFDENCILDTTTLLILSDFYITSAPKTIINFEDYPCI
jgi:hypothetical protein